MKSITQDEYDNLRKRFRKEQDDFKDKLDRLGQADEDYYKEDSEHRLIKIIFNNLRAKYIKTHDKFITKI